MPFPMMNDQHLSDLPFQYGEFEAGAQRQNVLDSQNLMNVYQQLMNERQSAMNPLDIAVRGRDAAFAQDEMDPNYRNWRMQGMTGEAKTKAATGDYDQGILKDKIASGIAEMKSKMSKSQYEQQITQMESLHTFLESVIPDLEDSAPGMDRNLRLMQAASESGVSPQIVSGLLKGRAGGDIEAMKKLKANLNYALTQSTKHKQDMEKELMKETFATERTQMTNDTTLRANKERQKDMEAEKRAEIEKAAARGNPEAFLMLADMTSDPAEKARYAQLATQAAARREAERRAMGVGGVNIGETTKGKVPTTESTNPYLGQQTQQSQTQYEVGKEYPGKTGTYKYKGGDPKNQANWEKVK